MTAIETTAGHGESAGEARVTNVVLAGLGGQGVIKASDILADAALRAGLDVKKSELHGMSQRGGSVTSDVRFGRTPADRVLSPMVPRGEADFLVVLAPSEVEVTRAALRPGGLLLSPDLIPDADLPDYYRAADVFVLPSIFETFGCVLVEAMASGLPIISTTAGGIPEVLTPETGILVEYGDVAQIADGCVAALQRSWDAQAILDRAREFAYPRFRERLAALLSA